MNRVLKPGPGPLLEVCIDNIDSGRYASMGGAHRIELCSALSEGGLTPSVGMLKTIKKHVDDIPIYVMIRPRGGNFVYSDFEIEAMKTDIKALHEAGADGFVFGALDKQGRVDKALCTDLLKEVPSGYDVTFHRAFDLAKSPEEALETIIELGFRRVLTSGQASSALEGKELLKKLVEQAKGRIVIMAGAGITPDNVKEIVDTTKVTEIHASCRQKISSSAEDSNSTPGRNVLMGSNKDEMDIFITHEGIVSDLLANCSYSKPLFVSYFPSSASGPR